MSDVLPLSLTRCTPEGFLGAPGLGGWRASRKGAVTHLSVEPRPPGGEHVLAEPGRAPAAAFPSGGVEDLHVRVARDPVHAEVGRLPRPARLCAAHTCGNKLKQRHRAAAQEPRARPTGHICVMFSSEPLRIHLRLHLMFSPDFPADMSAPAPHVLARPRPFAPTPRNVSACASCSCETHAGHVCACASRSHGSRSARSALSCSLTPSRGPRTDKPWLETRFSPSSLRSF